MELFRITETFEVELNKEWIMLIPEFKAILYADKGSKGDSDGRKKLLARKQFGYIYFMVDFKSPIYSWEHTEKHNEALRYVDLTEKEVSTKLVQDGMRTYKILQQKAARSLRTLDAAKKGLDALDSYLENVDFTAVDKQGKLLHSPKEFGGNITILNKVYDELKKFEDRVHKELQESATIRGNSELGDRENKRDANAQAGTAQWEEGGPEEGAAPAFTDMRVFLNRAKATRVSEDSSEEDDE